eukprot:1018793-Pyramimonas_sp.AAC.1
MHICSGSRFRLQIASVAGWQKHGRVELQGQVSVASQIKGMGECAQTAWDATAGALCVSGAVARVGRPVSADAPRFAYPDSGTPCLKTQLVVQNSGVSRVNERLYVSTNIGMHRHAVSSTCGGTYAGDFRGTSIRIQCQLEGTISTVKRLSQ